MSPLAIFPNTLAREYIPLNSEHLSESTCFGHAVLSNTGLPCEIPIQFSAFYTGQHLLGLWPWLGILVFSLLNP